MFQKQKAKKEKWFLQSLAVVFQQHVALEPSFTTLQGKLLDYFFRCASSVTLHHSVVLI